MTRRRPRKRPLALAAILLAIVAFAGCGDYRGYGRVCDWPIHVDNRTGVTLDIYLDGQYYLTVTGGTVGTIPSIEEASHVLDAYDLDRKLRASRSFFLDREFVWLLE